MYGGAPGLKLEDGHQMSHGDTCNTQHLSFPNHFGTHLDAPYHFYEDGKKVGDFPIESWLIRHAICVHLTERPAPGSLLGPEVVERVNAREAEAVFIKTGYGDLRQDEVYWKNAPGFRPELAKALREYFPRIRFFGFDLISLGSLQHREVGTEAHREFLSAHHPILILEDVDLTQVRGERLSNVLVSPLFVEPSDGTPCTIWADLPF